MLVYHFLPARYALDNLTHRRMKIATFDDLNDPFDLAAFSHPHPRARRELRAWKSAMSQQYGMLCFCRGWHNTLLWSHYAEKHTGMALGFEVPDELLEEVRYVAGRQIIQRIDYRTARDLLFTKFLDWQYEAELRVYTPLQDRDVSTGLYFVNFSNQLRLKRVICGPLCTTSKAAISESLGGNQENVQLVKARLAFKTFRVVTQKRGFENPPAASRP
ncbi:MAG: DUF2971 domain-containing protein [Acidobacteria bacterium]|nr:DUF2971 domain-containing protein [Acidobacteriota bacterium]MCI0721821.1 DUF2971 domain-containing protein [Acidobacteriota bacterium]